MASPNLCTAADVYTRAGGQAALSQLIDPQSTGTYSTTTLNIAIADASNYVISAAGVQAQLAGYSQADVATYFPELVTVAAQLAIVFCWDYGTSGRARPDGVQRFWDTGNQMLDNIQERRRKLGAADFSPTPQHAQSQIDMDPDDTRGLGDLSAWQRGFC